MNNLSIAGNLVRDPESKTTQDGKHVCTFTVAVNRKRKDKDGNSVADFFRVSAWGALGENCQKYLSKGRKVGVTGSVSISTYLAQDGSPRGHIEVFANDVEFLNSGNTESNNQSSRAEPTPVNMPEGELPF